jgi:hypothetical protein
LKVLNLFTHRKQVVIILRHRSSLRIFEYLIGASPFCFAIAGIICQLFPEHVASEAFLATGIFFYKGET